MVRNKAKERDGFEEQVRALCQIHSGIVQNGNG